MKKIFLFLICLTNLHVALGQAGNIDASFAPQLFPPGTPYGGVQVGSIAVDSSGKLWTYYRNTSNNCILDKLLPNGQHDPAFSTINLGGDTIAIIKVILQSNDKALVSYYSTATGTIVQNIRRFNSNGSADASFNFSMPAGFSFGDMVIQNSTGQLLLGGTVQAGYTGANLLRYNTIDGSVDTTFNQGITSASGSIACLATYPTGEIMVGGNFTSFNGTARANIAKLNANGTLNSFNFTGVSPQVYNIVIQPDSKVLLGGAFTHTNGKKNLLRININGTLDTSFTCNTIDSNSSQGNIVGIIVQSTGKIVISGVFISVNGVARKNIARISSNGSTDLCFVSNTGPTASYGGYMKPDAEENIYMSGIFESYNGTPRINLVKIQGNNTAVINAVDDPGTIAHGIEDTVIANVLANDIYNGSTPTTSSVSLSLVSAPEGISMTAAGAVNVDSPLAPGNYTLTYSICSGSCLCDTGTVTITVEPALLETVNDSFLPTCINGLNGGVVGDVTANDLMDGEILDDSLITITLTDNAGISNATLDQAGVLSIPMGTPAGNYEIQYKICEAGTTNCVTGRARFCVNQILNTGSGPNNVIYDIKVQPNGYIVIGGAFTTYNGVPRNRIARLKPDLTLDTTFDPSGIGFNGTVYSVALQGNNILVGGSFTARTDGTPKQHLARLTSTGALDTSFTNHTFNSVNGSHVRVIKLTPDNNIMVGGVFDNMDALAGTASIVKLNSSGNIVSSFVSPYSSPTSGVVFDIFIYTNASMLLGSSAIVLNQNGYTRFLVKVNSSGVVDPAFTTGYFPTLSGYVTSIAVNVAGKIIVGGIFDNYNYSGRSNLVQLTSAGVFDSGAVLNTGSGFGTSGFSNGPVYCLATDSSNKLYVSGNFSTYNGNSAIKLFRLDSTGNFDGTFNAGTGFNGQVYKIIMQPADGKILTGGNFTIYNGNTAKFITRLIPTYNSTAVQGRLMAPGLSDKNVVIYPNPSEGIFNIELSGYDDVTFDVTVHNTLGQVLYKGSISSQNTNQVDLTRFQAGNYFITLQNSYETINKVVTVK